MYLFIYFFLIIQFLFKLCIIHELVVDSVLSILSLANCMHLQQIKKDLLGLSFLMNIMGNWSFSLDSFFTYWMHRAAKL